MASQGQTTHESLVNAEQTCTNPSIWFYAEPLPGLSITFRTLMKILSAVAVILCFLITNFVLCGHLFHWTNPKEQVHIFRIILFLDAFSVCAFWTVWFYSCQGYLNPIAEYYEGFAMVSLFLLYVTYITPDDDSREIFYDHLERRLITGAKKGSGGSLRWFKIICGLVFQIIPTRIVTMIVAEVIRATTCPLSGTRKYGTIVAEVISGFSTAFTIFGIILFERRMHRDLAQHRPLVKLFAFKSIVGLQFTQDILFTFLAEYRVYTPTKYVSYMDFSVGIPNFILCWELFLFSLLFIKAFGYHPYRVKVQQGYPAQKSLRRALLDSLNVIHIIIASRFLITGRLTLHDGLKSKIENKRTASEATDVTLTEPSSQQA